MYIVFFKQTYYIHCIYIYALYYKWYIYIYILYILYIALYSILSYNKCWILYMMWCQNISYHIILYYITLYYIIYHMVLLLLSMYVCNVSMCVWRWYLVFHTHTCVCVYVRPFLFPWCVDSCFPSAKSRHLFPGLAPSGACSSSKVWKPKSHQLRRNSSRFHATTCAVRFNRLSIAGWRHFRIQNSRDVGMLGCWVYPLVI